MLIRFLKVYARTALCCRNCKKCHNRATFMYMLAFLLLHKILHFQKRVPYFFGVLQHHENVISWCSIIYFTCINNSFTCGFFIPTKVLPSHEREAKVLEFIVKEKEYLRGSSRKVPQVKNVHLVTSSFLQGPLNMSRGFRHFRRSCFIIAIKLFCLQRRKFDLFGVIFKQRSTNAIPCACLARGRHLARRMKKRHVFTWVNGVPLFASLYLTGR